VKLIVGLGNPGKEYATSRHNIGFLVINQLARKGNLKAGGAREYFQDIK
jgi:PTH1 family peptidyl-tRNA hydrolase